MTTTHTARFHPRGNYRAQIPGDPNEYLNLADETKDYALDVKTDYRPFPFLAVSVDPNYSANSRNTSQTGELAPQRRSKTLAFNWGATLNLPMSRGTLTGTLTRTENTNRELNFNTTLGTEVR